jgi:hypothetical protein
MFQVSSFRFQVSGFKFQVSSFRFSLYEKFHVEHLQIFSKTSNQNFKSKLQIKTSNQNFKSKLQIKISFSNVPRETLRFSFSKLNMFHVEQLTRFNNLKLETKKNLKQIPLLFHVKHCNFLVFFCTH